MSEYATRLQAIINDLISLQGDLEEAVIAKNGKYSCDYYDYMDLFDRILTNAIIDLDLYIDEVKYYI